LLKYSPALLRQCCTVVCTQLWLYCSALRLSPTAVDLLGGCLLGYAVLQLWQRVEQPYNSWLAHHPLLPLHVAAVSFLVMHCSPMAGRPTAAYGYCTAWLGGWAGVTLGYRLLHPVAGVAATAAAAAAGMSGVQTAGRIVGLQQQLGALPLWMAVALMTVKLVVGLAAVAATKVVVKEGMLLVLSRAFRLVPICVRCLWQPPLAGEAKGNRNSSSRSSKVSNQSSRFNDSSSNAESNDSHGSSSSSSLWVLRHAPDGTANDVAVTARFAAYVAVGFVVATFGAAWQPMVAHYMYASSTA
jgi:hypothetical protein